MPPAMGVSTHRHRRQRGLEARSRVPIVPSVSAFKACKRRAGGKPGSNRAMAARSGPTKVTSIHSRANACNRTSGCDNWNATAAQHPLGPYRTVSQSQRAPLHQQQFVLQGSAHFRHLYAIAERDESAQHPGSEAEVGGKNLPDLGDSRRRIVRPAWRPDQQCQLLCNHQTHIAVGVVEVTHESRTRLCTADQSADSCGLLAGVPTPTAVGFEASGHRLVSIRTESHQGVYCEARQITFIEGSEHGREAWCIIGPLQRFECMLTNFKAVVFQQVIEW